MIGIDQQPPATFLYELKCYRRRRTAMPALADDFTALFRIEHREVRDLLLELVDAFETRDAERARTLVGRIAAVTGPHFRYEEEALYPALVPLFGERYVGSLVAAHDGAIARARTLAAAAANEHPSDEEVAGAIEAIREILPHVSDCDGLSVMVEVLPEERVAAILDARGRALAAGLDLLSWADGVRARALPAA
jgi:hypothetical protein